MAANAYTLSMTNIDINEITIAVADKSAAIEQGEVKIRKYDSGTKLFADFTAFTLSGNTSSVAKIIPNSGSEFTTADLLIIQIEATEDTTLKKSDKVMVDFDAEYTDHTADYAFELPSTAGSYKMKLDEVNDMDFSAVETSAFEVVANTLKPTTAASSISAKDYLVHFTDEILNVKVILNNAGGDASEGNYEVSLSADLQA